MKSLIGDLLDMLILQSGLEGNRDGIENFFFLGEFQSGIFLVAITLPPPPPFDHVIRGQMWEKRESAWDASSERMA